MGGRDGSQASTELVTSMQSNDHYTLIVCPSYMEVLAVLLLTGFECVFFYRVLWIVHLYNEL